MISLQSHRLALTDRIAVIERILDETHPAAPAQRPIAREARGMAIVLIFAAYEELLTSLNRSLLEVAARMRVGNRRLQPGLRAFAMHESAKSLRGVSERKLFVTALPAVVEKAAQSAAGPTINPDVFPSDGSFMKRSQIKLWCDLFRIGDPAPVLQNIWQQIDTVVTQRNGVAHGRLAPQDVGRSYTEDEIRLLVENWGRDWGAFLDLVEARAQDRSFYRLPR